MTEIFTGEYTLTSRGRTAEGESEVWEITWPDRLTGIKVRVPAKASQAVLVSAAKRAIRLAPR